MGKSRISYGIEYKKVSVQLVSLKKQIIRAGILIIGLTLLGTTNSKATLQANPTTHKSPATKVGATWITEIRQMETTGQTMGLYETLNGLNATEENGIDVHMMLPTEYGAVAILSASGYGNSGKLRDEADAQKRTTTGNSTGVYYTGEKWEWLAADKHTGANKYNNTDTNNIGSIICTNGVAGWHDGVSKWSPSYPWSENSGQYAFRNAYVAGGNGIFTWGIIGDNGPSGGSWKTSWASYGNLGRGSTVCLIN